MFRIDHKVKSKGIGQLKRDEKKDDIADKEKEQTFGKAGF